MKHFVLVVICGSALLATAVAAAGPPIALPVLTKTASRLSGISVKPKLRVVYTGVAGMRAQATRVLDRDYPPDQQGYDETLYRALGLLAAGETLRPALLRATTNVLGLYDPVTHTLYVRKGKSVKRALVHELVHALQDKAFDLRRLASLRRGSRDAAAAAAAAVEGDASFATQLGGRVLAATARRDEPATPLATFLQLEHEFPYTTGVRFIAMLHNLGGNRAVFTALRTFPQTTKQVFHVDAFLTREPPADVALTDTAGDLSLVRGDTFGELDVRALLATFRVSGLDRAADGWLGGRSALFRDSTGREASVLVLTWETRADAAQWAEAATLYVNEAFDAGAPGLPASTSCAATVCWSVAGRAVAFVRDGARTALAFASTTDDAAAVARAVVR